jgi:hypothetical protein
LQLHQLSRRKAQTAQLALVGGELVAQALGVPYRSVNLSSSSKTTSNAVIIQKI